jgi:Protein of unknown function (DUF4058)
MPIHDWSGTSEGEFHDLHLAWLAELRKVLNKNILPPGFYARAEQRIGIIEPDMVAFDQRVEPFGETGGLAIAEVQPKTREQYHRSSSVARQRQLVIRHKRTDRAVAFLEIVSPGNRQSTVEVERFVRKAQASLAHGYHLLIIDLFPPNNMLPFGVHARIWESDVSDFIVEPERPLFLLSYVAGADEVAYVEPVAVGQQMMDMPLFLSPTEYVNVPMESTYMEAFASGQPRRG